MRLSPDELIFWQYGFFKLNATIVFTWGLMAVLVVGSMLITRTLSTELHRSRWSNLLEAIVIGVLGTLILLIAAASLCFFTPNAIAIFSCVLLIILFIGYMLIRRALSTELKRSRWQTLLEIVVTGILKQIEEVGLSQPHKYLSFLGTLFLFIAAASLGTIIPGYEPPTGSLSTTVALALCVFVAVPLFGIEEQGLGSYLKSYVKPTFIMLPFNIISELSRTLALAIRLFGNMMSGAMIIGILLSITPFFFPIVMTLLGLLTGMVQAYIFSILAAVYIAAATRVRKPKPEMAANP